MQRSSSNWSGDWDCARILGTLAGGAVGAVAGVLISVGLNTKSDRLGGESVVSGTKKLVKWAVNMNDNLKSEIIKNLRKRM